ncbi:DUF6990 domain-containing protein [Bartonella tribocorum]|uniref:Uncharacterized protein n=1 Tax=Bartonella tribocorum (strain DSM 28219 / CCUG 45778 / CIP 105476 / IBS 506) TaxID=382640 RepID=A9IXY1_BART1|nr:hypothetical protein [Bartonella tribocorum]CAK02260.1 hypothetical protein BT_2154 [Bartonella tribocorum CIP 105476]CDO49570.1 hypothetical protein BM1374166_01926 [Bartonella tribocorum]
MNIDPIVVHVLDPAFWVIIAIFIIIIMLVLALYRSVFKRMKMNVQVKGALEEVLKENDLALQQFWKDEGVLQERRLKLKEKEPFGDYDDHEILTIESATALLKSLGWSVDIEGKGDYLATLFLPDREVQFLYNEEQVEDFSPFDRGLLIMSGIFAAACQTINPHNSGVLPTVFINFVPNGLQIFEEKVSVARFKKALDKTLKWTMEDDCLHEILCSQYRIPPWKKDSLTWSTAEAELAPYALLHLGALVLLGDVETLGSYDERFTAGETLGFDETIEKVHLERAMVMAQEVKKAGKFSYGLLEQVALMFSIDVEGYQIFRVRDPNLCNKKRTLHKNLVEEKKQELREQGYAVSDKPCVFEKGGVKYSPDITTIKDGEPAFMDI